MHAKLARVRHNGSDDGFAGTIRFHKNRSVPRGPETRNRDRDALMTVCDSNASSVMITTLRIHVFILEGRERF